MNILSFLFSFAKTLFKSDLQKDLEILALRSQLAIFQQHLLNHKTKKPRLPNSFRRLWVFLSKAYPGWKDALMLVKPETVIGWLFRIRNNQHRTQTASRWSLSGKPVRSR